jgi:hypothetical protein
MKIFNYVFLSLIIIAPLTTMAETIYKSVDKNGAAVFSDKRTPEAEKINVQPNVVDVNIPDMPAPAQKHTNKQRSTHTNTTQNQVIESGRGTATTGNLKRKIRIHTNGEGINRPVTRPTVRTGSHR